MNVSDECDSDMILFFRHNNIDNIRIIILLYRTPLTIVTRIPSRDYYNNLLYSILGFYIL